MKTKLNIEDAIDIAKIHHASFVAMDEDRAIHIFNKFEPVNHVRKTRWWETLDGYKHFIGMADDTWNEWKNSLIRVQE